jgi:hypothetical protein
MDFDMIYVGEPSDDAESALQVAENLIFGNSLASGNSDRDRST